MPSGTSGLTVVFAAQTQEKLEILYDAAGQQLIVRETVLGADGALTTRVKQAPHLAGAMLKLRVLVDGSVAEIIADEVTSLTSRVYPSAVAECSVQLVGSGTLDVWEMPSIWQLSQS